MEGLFIHGICLHRAIKGVSRYLNWLQLWLSWIFKPIMVINWFSVDEPGGSSWELYAWYVQWEFRWFQQGLYFLPLYLILKCTINGLWLCWSQTSNPWRFFSCFMFNIIEEFLDSNLSMIGMWIRESFFINVVCIHIFVEGVIFIKLNGLIKLIHENYSTEAIVHLGSLL